MLAPTLGITTVICVPGPFTETDEPAQADEIETAAPLTKPLPLMVTVLPPAWGPAVGFTLVITGAAPR